MVGTSLLWAGDSRVLLLMRGLSNEVEESYSFWQVNRYSSS